MICTGYAAVREVMITMCPRQIKKAKSWAALFRDLSSHSILRAWKIGRWLLMSIVSEGSPTEVRIVRSELTKSETVDERAAPFLFFDNWDCQGEGPCLGLSRRRRVVITVPSQSTSLIVRRDLSTYRHRRSYLLR